jgi:hypothetical protein
MLDGPIEKGSVQVLVNCNALVLLYAADGITFQL